MSHCKMEFKLIGNGEKGDPVEVVEGCDRPSVTRLRSKLVTDAIYRINSKATVRGLSVTTDENDNVFVLGQFFQNMFTENIYLETTNSAIFLAQLNDDGSWRWGRIIHEHNSPNDIRMSSQIVYKNKYLYSAMIITNTMTGLSEGLVIKTDRGGNIKYKTRFVGNLQPVVRISLDRNGNAYISNSYERTVTFTSTIKLSTDGTIRVGNTDVPVIRGYVAKLNKHGDWVWARDIEGCDNRDNSGLNDIVTKPNGDSYVIGWFIGVVKLGDMTLKYARNSNTRAFLMAEIGNGGNWIRAIAFPNGEGTGIDMDCDKNIYITGGFANKLRLCGAKIDVCGIHIFVAKLDRRWGADWVTATKYDTSLLDSIINIVVDKDLNTYIDGPFDQPICFNRKMLVPRSTTDEFVAKVSPNGSWVWAGQISGSRNATTDKNIIVDNYGNLYITGAFTEALIIGKKQEFGNTTLPSLFLAVIKPRLPKLIGIVEDVCYDKAIVVFDGPVKLKCDRLDVGYEYYIDYEGDISTCSKYKYLGTAISEHTIYLKN